MLEKHLLLAVLRIEKGRECRQTVVDVVSGGTAAYGIAGPLHPSSPGWRVCDLEGRVVTMTMFGLEVGGG